MSERCSSWNRRGGRCGAWALTGATTCSLHSDPGRAGQLGSKHGWRRRARSGIESSIDTIGLPYKTLKTMVDVSELMEETINRVRQGSLDPRSANTIGFLASVHMKAIAEARTETLRDKAGEDTRLIYQPIFERMRKGLAVSPEEEAYMNQEPSPLYPELRQEDAGVAPEPLWAPRDTETPDSDPLNPIKVEVD